MPEGRESGPMRGREKRLEVAPPHLEGQVRPGRGKAPKKLEQRGPQRVSIHGICVERVVLQFFIGVVRSSFVDRVIVSNEQGVANPRFPQAEQT